jgi:hypothetical protein
MRKKQFEVGMSGLFIGILVGIILGIVELHWMKKSQADTMVVPAIVISMAITAIAGYTIGSSIGKTIYIEGRLGIDKAKEEFFKSGRYWMAKTQWTDTRSNQHFTIETQRVGGSLCSTFNGRVFRNHGIPNANQQTVPRYHRQTVKEVFDKLKSTYVEGKVQEITL